MTNFSGGTSSSLLANKYLNYLKINFNLNLNG